MAPAGAPTAVRETGSPTDLIAALRTVVGPDQIQTDPDITAAYSRDMMPLAPSGTPLAVVFPTDTAQVAGVVRACAAAGVPIVPRGAGSGLTGAANAVDGAVSVVMTRMNRILEIDEGNRLAVVQPGVVNLDFRTEVESRGLFYAPDPSSYDWCTIGGNLSTNAGGLCCVKYGVTTDAVLGLEVVLASGEVLRTGRRTVKGVAGYDLTKLIVGSEGTLGIITEATLALRPRPAAPCTMVAAFADTESAGAAVSARDPGRAGAVADGDHGRHLHQGGGGAHGVEHPGRRGHARRDPDRPVRRRAGGRPPGDGPAGAGLPGRRGGVQLRHRRPGRGPAAAAGPPGGAAVAGGAGHLAHRRRRPCRAPRWPR